MKIPVGLVDSFPIQTIRHSPKTQIEPFHWHSALEIGYCVAGKGSFHFHGKVYDVAQGDVVVINGMQQHIARSDGDDPSEYVFVYFRPQLLENEDRELLLPFFSNPASFNNLILSGHRSAKIVGDLISGIHAELESSDSAYKTIVRAMLMLACSELYRYYSSESDSSAQNETSRRNSIRTHARIRPALEYIKEHFSEPLSLNEVAREIGLSPSRAYHVFKEATGENFKEYLIQVRLNEAKKRLIHSSDDITSIYLDAGFQSSASFYRAFQKMVGVKPSEYRAEHGKYHEMLGSGGTSDASVSPDFPAP